VGRDPQRALILFAVLLAVGDGLFGTARTGIAASTALFSAAAFLAGGRTLVASAFALATPPEIRPTVTALRAATMQFGYFVGSSAGGVALAIGGYSAFGASLAALFLGAAAILAHRRARRSAPTATGRLQGASAK
jgi:predicted MFS family arabinose efflux permease